MTHKTIALGKRSHWLRGRVAYKGRFFASVVRFAVSPLSCAARRIPSRRAGSLVVLCELRPPFLRSVARALGFRGQETQGPLERSGMGEGRGMRKCPSEIPTLSGGG